MLPNPTIRRSQTDGVNDLCCLEQHTERSASATEMLRNNISQDRFVSEYKLIHLMQKFYIAVQHFLTSLTDPHIIGTS